MSVNGFPFIAPGATQDFVIQKQYPGVELVGTEALGEWTESREINGSLWFAIVNATWNNATNTGFTQVNPLVASSAASLSPTGVITVYEVGPGAANPIVWTTTTTVGGLPIPVPVVDGGTGLISPGPAGFFLASNGTGYVPTAIPSSATLPWFRLKQFGAAIDGVTDDTQALKLALAACGAAGGGTIIVDLGANGALSLILGSTGIHGPLVWPSVSGATGPVMEGTIQIWGAVPPAKKSNYSGQPRVGGAGFDLRENGVANGALAKIDLRALGLVVLKDLMLVSGGTDNLQIIGTTQTTLLRYNCHLIGNVANDGGSCVQRGCQNGGIGFGGNYGTSGNQHGPVTNGAMTAGSATLTAGSGWDVFDPTMAPNGSNPGWQVTVSGAGVAGATLTAAIVTYVSPTSVTLSVAATTTVTNATVTSYGYFSGNAFSGGQGYGGAAYDQHYSNLDACEIIGNAQNNMSFYNPFCDFSCGGGEAQAAPFIGYQGGIGTSIFGGYIETTNYQYIAALMQANNAWTIIGVGQYDHPGQAALVYFDASSRGNIAFGSEAAAGATILGGPGAVYNSCIAPGPNQSQLAGSLLLAYSAGVLQATTLAVTDINPIGTNIVNAAVINDRKPPGAVAFDRWWNAAGLEASAINATTAGGFHQAFKDVTAAGGMTATSATLVATTSVFSPGMVGQSITVAGAGVAGANLVTTISAYTNATTVTLTVAASTTVVAAVVSMSFVVCGLRGDVQGAVQVSGPGWSSAGTAGAILRPSAGAASGMFGWDVDQNSGAGALIYSNGSGWKNAGTGAAASP